MSAIFRHILEDPVTLQAAMEAEIRNTLSARGQQADTREGASFAASFSALLVVQDAHQHLLYDDVSCTLRFRLMALVLVAKQF